MSGGAVGDMEIADLPDGMMADLANPTDRRLREVALFAIGRLTAALRGERRATPADFAAAQAALTAYYDRVLFTHRPARAMNERIENHEWTDCHL